MILRLLFVLGKYLLITLVAAIVIGRLFLPKLFETSVVTPVRGIPIVGDVLGVTWDASGSIGTSLTDSTVELADKVESTNLPIDETITSVAISEDPKKAASDVIDRQIDLSIKKFEHLPAAAIEEIRQEIRKEMYQQICYEWLGDVGSSSSAQKTSE